MMKWKNILSGLIAICAISMILSVSCSQAANKIETSASAPVIGITSGRARALVAVAVGLISMVIGGFARSAGRIGTASGRAGAIMAVVLGLICMVMSVVHLGYSTGGFGTGGGRAGASVALVRGLIGINRGGRGLARSRRSRTT